MPSLYHYSLQKYNFISARARSMLSYWYIPPAHEHNAIGNNPDDIKKEKSTTEAIAVRFDPQWRALQRPSQSDFDIITSLPPVLRLDLLSATPVHHDEIVTEASPHDWMLTIATEPLHAIADISKDFLGRNTLIPIGIGSTT